MTKKLFTSSEYIMFKGVFVVTEVEGLLAVGIIQRYIKMHIEKKIKAIWQHKPPAPNLKALSS